jgi:hypothetical protein
MAPPAADPCLDRADSASGKKGGTIIVPEVTSVEEHDRRLDEGLYRLPACGRRDCGGSVHSHGMRTRSLKGGLGTLGELAAALILAIAIYRCSRCGAVWRVLPGFVPRWLHSQWAVVVETVADVAPRTPRVPARTRRRWRARLRQSARKAVQVLALAMVAQLRDLVALVGLTPPRHVLVVAFAPLCVRACPFASLAELLHRMTPGIRLM